MSNSYFFHRIDKNSENHKLIDSIEQWSVDKRQQTYVLDKPLGEEKYSYDYDGALVILSPKRKILFVDIKNNPELLQEYVDDFIEDLGSIADKFRYRSVIGRPRSWGDLYQTVSYDFETWSADNTLSTCVIEDPERQRVVELLISLLTGSINDIDKVSGPPPQTLLDRVKQKIVLFDGEQTRFIYQNAEKQQVRIQGLSGTGKTELLLHKLKDIYVNSEHSKVAFTCHNRILADSLRRRIPDFFNFMKVEQQISWNERLWCMHAWGSQGDPSSGTYRFICHHFGLPFFPWSRAMNFDRACRMALEALKNRDISSKPFDTILIDESQDFPESFFELCNLSASNTVYIAGDVFQSIFDEDIVSEIDPDFLLSKCYRTDPSTLMFAHGLGMGLFEKDKLRWLEDKEWEVCGYSVEHINNGNRKRLRREPLRRFEDLAQEDLKSMEIVLSHNPFYDSVATTISSALDAIRKEHPTVKADDIGIILLDGGSSPYALADKLEQLVPRSFGWNVNKAYESKRRIPDTLFISNKNNVKGLEFPFVICVARSLYRHHSFRNALYMTMTRSFIKTYLIIEPDVNEQMLPSISEGLHGILSNGYMDISVPPAAEQASIRTKISIAEEKQSYYDFVSSVFDELDIPEIFRTNLYDIIRKINGDNFDRDKIYEIAQFNYRQMAGE